MPPAVLALRNLQHFELQQSRSQKKAEIYLSLCVRVNVVYSAVFKRTPLAPYTHISNSKPLSRLAEAFSATP